MFCNQCEQTAKGGCTVKGVCGKSPEVAALQDLLGHALQSLASVVEKARPAGIDLTRADRHIMSAMFSLLTNVTFDPEQVAASIVSTVELRDALKQELEAQGVSLDDTIAFEPADTLEAMIEQGDRLGLIVDRQADADIRSLQEIVLYGCGDCAYAHHAQILGQENAEIYQFMTRSGLTGSQPDGTGRVGATGPGAGASICWPWRPWTAAIPNILAIQSRPRCHWGTKRANASWYQAMTSRIWRTY